MKLEGRFRPNLASNPAGLSYPPTLHKPLPLPSKTLYPWWGSRVELNKGQGRSAVTPGLPLPITSHGLLWACVGLGWLLWAFVGLRWPPVAVVGCYGPLWACVGLR